jgi:hypothetical protein
MIIAPSSRQRLRRKCAALLAFTPFFLMLGAPAQAADFAGGTLTVVRDAETADCPDEATLAAATLALGRSPADHTGGIAVSVVFQRDAFGYGAIVTTAGTQAGVRELRKPGPSCATLAEAVRVVLAVLFDLAPPEQPAAGDGPAPPPPPPPSSGLVSPPTSNGPEQRVPRQEPATLRRPRVTVGVGAQGAGGYGLLGAAPVGAVTGAVRVGIGRWELGAGALGAPNRAVEYIDGVVYVSMVAGRLVGCGWLFSSRTRPDLGLCGGVLLGRMRARGNGFDLDAPVATDAWFAAEAGVAARMPLTANLAFRFGISLIVPSRSQQYTVRLEATPRTAFRSSPAAGLLEVGPELRFP